jgi:ornithine cyclodeaminase
MNGEKPGRVSSSQITLFDSVGFAIEDFSALRYLRKLLETAPYYEDLDMLADPDEPRDLFGMLLRAKKAAKAALPRPIHNEIPSAEGTSRDFVRISL